MDRIDMSLDDIIKSRPKGGGKAQGKPDAPRGVTKGAPKGAAGGRGSPYGRPNAQRPSGGGTTHRIVVQPRGNPQHGGGNRVYVGNLSWQTTWQTLKDVMRSAGEVVRVDVMTEPGGRSKGCALVEYEDSQAAAHAIASLTDHELDGRLIFVREDREDKRSGEAPVAHNASGPSRMSSDASDCSVYVGNIDWQVSWQQLKDAMKSAGEVVRVEMLTESTGRSKGCALVQFATPAGALAAIDSLQDLQVGSRPIWLREDRGSGGAAGGQEQQQQQQQQHGARRTRS